MNTPMTAEDCKDDDSKKTDFQRRELVDCGRSEVVQTWYCLVCLHAGSSDDNTN